MVALFSVTQVSAEDLFSLPLYEVLDVNVEARQWQGRLDDGIYVIEAGSPARLFQEILLAGQLQDEILLAIDGCEAGAVYSTADAASYIHFFFEEMAYVEFYSGESAGWWSGGDFSIVVNIVTRDANDTDSDSRLMREVEQQ